MLPQSLVSKTASELKKIILRLDSQNGKLPNENELAEILHVNRTTLRQALAILEYEGYIFRKQKKGTCVNPYVTGLGLRLEDIEEINQQLVLNGYAARTEHANFTYEPAPLHIAKKLNVEPETVLLNSQALFFAGNTPAAFARDKIPVHLFKKPIDIHTLNQLSIFKFLADYCGIQVKHEISSVNPLNDDDALCQKFNLPPATAFLQVNSVVFDFSNNPVMHSEITYHPQYFQFSVVRRLNVL